MLAAVALGQPPAVDPIGDLISRTDGDFNSDYLEPLLRASCPPGSNGKEPEAMRDSDREKAAVAPTEMAAIIAAHTGASAEEVEAKLEEIEEEREEELGL